MKLLIPLLVLACGVAPAAPQQDGPESRAGESRASTRPVPVTPAEKVAEIDWEFGEARKAFSKAFRAAKTPEEREKLSEEAPRAETWFPRLMEIVKAHPKDPAAAKALVWMISHDDDSSGKNSKEALALLARDHMESPEVKDAVDDLQYRVGEEAERFLRAVAGSHPLPEVKARATYALAHHLKTLAGLARRIAETTDPEALKKIEARYTAEELSRLRAVDGAGADKEVEELLVAVKEKHADVRAGWGGTLGERAEGDLFEIRNLAIGKVAPEIEGEDIEGKPLKLSDFRGRVVVIDFWGHW